MKKSRCGLGYQEILRTPYYGVDKIFYYDILVFVWNPAVVSVL